LNSFDHLIGSGLSSGFFLIVGLDKDKASFVNLTLDLKKLHIISESSLISNGHFSETPCKILFF